MLKKIMKASFVIALVVLMFTVLSCAGKKGVMEEKYTGEGHPSWFLNPPSAEDAIYGVGSAKMSSLNMSRTMAVSRARDDVARQMKVLVKGAILDYAQEAGVEEEPQVINFAETISVQITETTLRGCKTERVEEAKDGTLYALVLCPLDLFVEEAASEFRRSEDAAFAEFKAREAEKWLEKQMSGNPTGKGRCEECP